MPNLMSAKILSAFSMAAYEDDQKAAAKYVPEGFTWLCDRKENIKDDHIKLDVGYYGIAYYRLNAETDEVDLVIAHRGTDNAKNAFDDVNIYFQNAPRAWEQGAKPFTDYALNQAKAIFPNKRIKTSITGHSLGATLADLTAADLAGRPDTDLDTLVCGSFENPGSLDIIKDQIKKKNLTQDAIEKVKPCTFIHNNDPDAITACGPQLSDRIYHCKSGYTFGTSDPTTKKYYTDDFTLDQHHMKKLYELLNSSVDISDKITLQSSWPFGGIIPGYDYYMVYTNNPGYWDLALKNYWDNNTSLHHKYPTADAYTQAMIQEKLSGPDKRATNTSTGSVATNGMFGSALTNSWIDLGHANNQNQPESEQPKRGWGCSVM